MIEICTDENRTNTMGGTAVYKHLDGVTPTKHETAEKAGLLDNKDQNMAANQADDDADVTAIEMTIMGDVTDRI